MSKSADRSRKWREIQREKYGADLLKKKNALRMRIFRKEKMHGRIRLRKMKEGNSVLPRKASVKKRYAPGVQDLTTKVQATVPVVPSPHRSDQDSKQREIDANTLQDDDIYRAGELQEGDVTASHLVFKTPFTCLVAGPTGAGKTHFITEILRKREEMIDQPLDEIIWCYGIHTKQLAQLKEEFGDLIKLHRGMPDLEKLGEKETHLRRLLILDDLMTEMKGNVISQLFSRGSHHLNMSTILIVQNVFHQSREMRNVFLNAHYKVIFKSPSDMTQLQHLNMRMFPGHPKFFKEVMTDAGKNSKYAYIVLDAHTCTPDELRVRANIFPGQENGVYLPE